jgi:diguanylate cyclase (GGDEF)-like protein/PAS domain S-box-containing protein
MKGRNPSAAGQPSAVVATIASTVLLASALPLAAIGWMLFSGAASLIPALVLALATLAVDTVLVLRIMSRAAEPPHGGEELFDRPSPARATGDERADADWTWQIDTSRNLTAVSPRFARALGKDPAELEGRSILQVLAGEAWASGSFAPALHTVADKIKAREAFDRIVLPVTVSGETLWWELSGAPQADPRGAYSGFKGTGADVTAARRTADKINRMARFDTLTGLPNRLQMTEALGEAIEAAEHWKSRCGFMIIDLDRFKGVNDTLGHAVGDRLLNRVAERLTSLCSENELCGRLGGDEFGVVVKDASDQARVDQLARRIIDELSKAYDVDNHTLYVGASVGTAIGPRDGNTAETLIRSADLALYRSKDSGGNAHHPYEPQLHADAEERRVMEIALRRALANNEFHLQYQPVVSAETGTVEGFEALLRWTNKQLGNVPPSKFVPLAEEARLIGPIGQWVLRTACQEAMNWPSTVRVAVNVSAEQLHDRNFAKAVASALHDTGLPPHRLELEVTESVFMEEATHAVSVLKEVLALGIKLSLDDFGTGYSSLGYLSRTKFSNIKIDRSFVQGAARNVLENVAIIRAVIALADSLGMSTTAEGVETEEELAMIRGLGCRKIQGYLFGRPMSAHDARALFSSGSRSAAA